MTPLATVAARGIVSALLIGRGGHATVRSELGVSEVRTNRPDLAKVQPTAHLHGGVAPGRNLLLAILIEEVLTYS